MRWRIEKGYGYEKTIVTIVFFAFAHHVNRFLGMESCASLFD